MRLTEAERQALSSLGVLCAPTVLRRIVYLFSAGCKSQRRLFAMSALRTSLARTCDRNVLIY